MLFVFAGVVFTLRDQLSRAILDTVRGTWPSTRLRNNEEEQTGLYYIWPGTHQVH